MEYRKLGKTDLSVSRLCLGTMQFGWTADEETSYQVLSAAFDSGINFIDTADIYSLWVDGNPGGVAETIIGNWMTKNDVPREKLVIATKVRGRMSQDPQDEGLSRQHIIKSVEGSLKRLQTDYLDLYQSHWYDGNVPIEETLRTFDDLVHAGKVRYIGCSNYPAWRLVRALWISDLNGLISYDSYQPHYNLVHRAEFERELAEVCLKFGLGVIPYSPLGGGFLTGKYKKGKKIANEWRGSRSDRIKGYMTDENYKLLELMEDFSRREANRSVSRLALAWLLARPAVTSPIIGPKNMEQLQDNLGAVDVRLTQDEKEALDKASAWEDD
jgi:aryl-alcohol dehydrogenase-like predicted oxidoreductase